MDPITMDTLKEIFLWMTIINLCVITIYFIIFVSARKFICKLHATWFKMTEKEVSTSLYKALAFYKIATIVLNLVPYIVLIIVDL